MRVSLVEVKSGRWIVYVAGKVGIMTSNKKVAERFYYDKLSENDDGKI